MRPWRWSSLTGRYRRLWFTEDQLRWAQELGIGNVSEYLRDKMREDVDRGVSLKALRRRLEDLDREKTSLEATFRAKAVQVEDAIRAFEAAAATVRENVAHVGRASVQSSILRWVQNNPNGRELRRFLPSEYGDPAIVGILLR